jgi:uncharacterized membrane-anchored protein
MPYVTVDVDVDLDDFDTEDLVKELKSRNGEMPNHVDSADIVNLVNEIYLARHVRKQNYDQLIDQLIYSITGKVV